MVTADRTYFHPAETLLSHCHSRGMDKLKKEQAAQVGDHAAVPPVTPASPPTPPTPPPTPPTADAVTGKSQMVQLAQALPAAIVLVVENHHHHHRGFIKERVVPRAPASATSSSTSTSTSSIGVCDDLENADESEVQSSLRTGPLESMDGLESSLPIKRGLSQFFDGKSRSFTSLKEVSSTEQLAKPESPFNSKRRKLLSQTRRIPASKSSANFKCRKDWSAPTFVRVTSSFLPRSFSHQHIISGVRNV